jgi:dUTP pyrophosphatase
MSAAPARDPPEPGGEDLPDGERVLRDDGGELNGFEQYDEEYCWGIAEDAFRRSIRRVSEATQRRLRAHSSEDEAAEDSDGATSTRDRPLTLVVERFSDKVRLPRRATRESAGFDLFAPSGGVVKARGRSLIMLGFRMRIARGRTTFTSFIKSRSGLAVRHGIEAGAGVVDADYRGEVGVLLHNHSDEDFSYAEGDAVAQLVIVGAVPHNFAEEAIDDDVGVDETERGAGGFGSTDAQAPASVGAVAE